MCRDMLVGELATYDGLGENRIGRRDGGSDNERGEEGEVRDECPDEEARGNPSVDHAGAKEEEQGAPVSFHIRLDEVSGKGVVFVAG